MSVFVAVVGIPTNMTYIVSIIGYFKTMFKHLCVRCFMMTV